MAEALETRLVLSAVVVNTVNADHHKLTIHVPAAQTADPGVPASIRLGSFTDRGAAGPFNAVVNWGDGSANTTFRLRSAGSLGSRTHTFLTASPVMVTVTVSKGSGARSTASFAVTAPADLTPTFTVNTTADQTDPAGSPTVSLRDAFALAIARAGPVTIGFDPNVFAAAETLEINSTLELAGDHRAPIVFIGPAAGVTLSGANVTIDKGITAGMSRFTISGGGISNSGTLALDASTVSGSSTESGISNSGRMSITNCTITGNHPTIPSNGLPDYLAIAGGISNGGRMAVTDSTISANTSFGAAAGGIDNGGQLTVTCSTINGNEGGGIGNSGHVTLLDSTVAGNEGDDNDAGGIYQEPLTSGTVKIANTIIAGNTVPIDGFNAFPDVSGKFRSLGHNLIGDTTSSSGWVKTDLTGTSAKPIDPDLSPLGYFGGPTQTQVPMSGSPAVEAGAVSVIPIGAGTDQRGFSRTVGGQVDIGAVELHDDSVITVAPPAAQADIAGTPVSVALGSFTGGEGPFTAIVNWGDGTPESQYSIAAAGSLGTQTHTFEKLGTLQGTVLVLDSAGDLSNFATLSIASSAGPAQTIVVNTAADSTDPLGDGTVSLRDAVNRADAAFGPITIQFDPKVFSTRQMISTQSELELKNDPAPISIEGPAAGVSIAIGIQVDASVTADISNLSGGFGNSGQVTLENCSGGINNNGQMTVEGCTSADNRLGILNSGQMDIVNSTVTGNASVPNPYPAGPYGGIANYGTLTVADSTIAANSQIGGFGGIDNEGTLTLSNTIVAGNGNANDIAGIGTIKSLGHNLIGIAPAGSGWLSSDLTGTRADPLNPVLSLLGDYGGLTQTLVPLAGSPAIGAGSVALIPAGDTTDQRGLPRVVVGGKVDIGAVEVQPSSG